MASEHLPPAQSDVQHKADRERLRPVMVMAHNLVPEVR
jgi:hypothetical protein